MQGVPSRPDYYKILSVPKTASQAEIKQAYYNSAQKLHPDKNPSPDATQEFQALQQAYSVLGDETQRARYDKNNVNAYNDLGNTSLQPVSFQDFLLCQTDLYRYGDGEILDMMNVYPEYINDIANDVILRARVAPDKTWIVQGLINRIQDPQKKNEIANKFAEQRFLEIDKNHVLRRMYPLLIADMAYVKYKLDPSSDLTFRITKLSDDEKRALNKLHTIPVNQDKLTKYLTMWDSCPSTSDTDKIIYGDRLSYILQFYCEKNAVLQGNTVIGAFSPQTQQHNVISHHMNCIKFGERPMLCDKIDYIRESSSYQQFLYRQLQPYALAMQNILRAILDDLPTVKHIEKQDDLYAILEVLRRKLYYS